MHNDLYVLQIVTVFVFQAHTHSSTRIMMLTALAHRRVFLLFLELPFLIGSSIRRAREKNTSPHSIIHLRDFDRGILKTSKTNLFLNNRVSWIRPEIPPHLFGFI